MTEQEALAKIKEYQKEIKRLRLFYVKKEAKPINESSMKDDSLFCELYPILSEDLSMRMIEVIVQVMRGKTNKQCGEALFVCEKTIKFHLTEIYYRLGLKSRSQLIVIMNQLIKDEKEANAG